MKVHFWGTRGSLPATYNAQTQREKVFQLLQLANGKSLRTDKEINKFIDNEVPFSLKGSYGTNTSCIQVTVPGNDYIICDCGSGLRDFGLSLANAGKLAEPATFHIFMTHLHWDHLQGFPFFIPAYLPGNKIIIHAYHKQTEESFRQQMSPPFFPIPFSSLAADIEFDLQEPCSPYQIGDIKVSAIQQNHPGISYGYRFEANGKSVVFSTDSEHKEDTENEDYPFIAFFKDADLLIFDAQYTIADANFNKINWGHSSNVTGVELAGRSKVKTLALFHHEPTSSDFDLEDFLLKTKLYNNIYHQEAPQRSRETIYPQNIILAYDGLVWET